MTSSTVEERMKQLLLDLGRPTLRGIRKCPKCSTVNGTRGTSCKNKSCDVIFRGRDRRRDPLETSQLSSLPGFDDVYFSVRQKDRSKEMRTFVVKLTETEDGKSVYECLSSQCKKKEGHRSCIHSVAAQKSQGVKVGHLPIKQTVLQTLHIPDNYLCLLSRATEESSRQVSVHRVAKTAFVVVSVPLPKEDCEESESPHLEVVHTMFSNKPSRSDSTDVVFMCTCPSIKEQEGSSNSQSLIQLCLHYYACLCAFASSESLAAEFEHYLPQGPSEPVQRQQQEISGPLLSQLHFVSNDGKSIELDPVSVEIMHDNMSLLEMGMSNQEDSNTRGLERVISDSIIVTNVDDALSFDAAVLDHLNEDEPVCHIFANPQTIHMSYPIPTSGSREPKEIFEVSTPSPVNGNDVFADTYIHPKRRRENVAITASVMSTRPYSTLTVTSTSQTKKPSTPIYFTKTEVTNVDEALPKSGDFEMWLAGVNDLINCLMNYQLKPQPEPLVYYIPTVYFDHLRERLTSLNHSVGGQKKRLPNHTFVFNRTDKAPVGSFTKHVWKITNVHHVLSVFKCAKVPLKVKQYFMKSNNGTFVDWVPPQSEEESCAQRQKILPVLHTTVLKCGRNYPSPVKENTPFIIEWVPDILRSSKLGELTIRFEFCKSEPTREAGREISI